MIRCSARIVAVRLNWGTAPVSFLDLLEIVLTLICLVLAFTRPDIGRNWFERAEAAMLSLSEHTGLCLLLLFLFPIVLRLLLLPVYGPPAPFISDEYAYLLHADTFSLGRLTNPSPPLWQHFTAVYLLAHPTYTAEYQVGQGMVLAAGQIVTGIPWAGVALSMGLLCAATYWALLAWTPRVWALAGTALLADIQLGVLSYWMNSYWGGCVPAVGGALALGALPRLRGGRRVLYSFVLAGGLIILLNSRMLEGILLTSIAAGALAYWTWISKDLNARELWGRVLPSLALSLAAVLAFMGYYNARVTGRATQFPYLLYRSEYGLPQGFFWQKPVLAPAGLPADIRAEFEDQWRQHERRRSVPALVGATGGKIRRFWEFYVGIPLTATLVFLPWIRWGSRRNVGLALVTLTVVLGLDNLSFFAYFPHYSAAVTVLIFLVLVECLRRMRASGPAGLFLSRALPLVCVLGLIIPTCGRWTEGVLPASLSGAKKLWQAEFEHEVRREHFVPELERTPGKQLVLVRYEPYDGGRKSEWIYNRANLGDAKIVWARESSEPSENRQLMEQFSGRKVWLAEPDAKPPRVTPYPQGLLSNSR